MAAPAAPSDVTIEDINGDEAVISWVDNATSEDGFRVYVSTDGGASWTQDSGDLAAGTTSYTTTALLDGEEYQIRVCAFNTDGETCDGGVADEEVGYAGVLQTRDQTTETRGKTKIFEQ